MLRRLSVALGTSLLMAVIGCGGAEESELFGPEASGGAPSTNTPAANTDSTNPSSPSATGGGSSADDVEAPATPAPNDPGSAPDPGAQKPVCTAESLDNDEFRRADEFDACIAGKLTLKDVDFVSIVAPANAKRVSIKHTEVGGKVSYRMFVNGFTMTFTDTPPEEIPAIPNARYTFKLEPAGGTIGDRDWQLEVTFQ